MSCPNSGDDSNHRENFRLQYQCGRPVILSLFLRLENEISRYSFVFIKPTKKTVSQISRSILSSSLLFGILFVPLRAVQADSIFTDSSSSLQVSGTNTNASSTIPTDDSGTALVPSVGPMGVSDGSINTDSDQTSVYVVKSDDSIAKIADMYGVSVDTILWANDMKKGDKLTTGEILLILPVSGIEYTVAKGDTLQKIAAHYNVDVNDIIKNNDVSLDPSSLNIGDNLIIPNGEKTSESTKSTSTKNTSKSTTKIKKHYVQSSSLADLSGYYVEPVQNYRRSQGIHDNNAVDLAVPRGTSVHAAASGTVTFAKLGYNGGFGGLVIISHPNGTETLYAHLSGLSTYAGQEVSQNDVIAFSGGVPGTPYAGHSTGAHLHFEVHGAKNPGVDDSWKN